MTLDTDLQNDPTDIPRLLDTLELGGYGVVSGRRTERRDSWLRRAASKIANGVRRRILDDPFVDIGCSLKAYESSYLRTLPLFDGLHRFLPIFAVWSGATAVEVPVAHRPRTRGVSKYGAVRGRLGRGLGDLCALLWLRRRWLGRQWQPDVPESSRRDPAPPRSAL